MGFRSRARARREAQMDRLGSTRDTVKEDILVPSDEGDESTILGVVQPVIDTPAVAPPTADDVPHGTTNEIKDWVGEDVDRARVAYEKEKASEKPRKVLVGHLEGMLNE